MTSKPTEADSRDAILQAVQLGYEKAGVALGSPLVLAVSGGMDSVLLLHVTVQIWGGHSSKLVVAHLNHSLRKSSGDDQEFVRAIAGRCGVLFETATLPIGQISESSASVEEAAREARYAFLSQVAKRHGASRVATAHHESDQAETILHNALRGTGLRGLGGMRVSRPMLEGGNLIRPMLGITYAQIVQGVQDRGLEFKEDCTNADNQITRNLLRNKVIPVLRKQVNSKAEANLARLAEQVSEVVEYLDEVAEAVLQRAEIERAEDVVRLHRGPIMEQKTYVRRHLMNLLWVHQHWPQQKMTRQHWCHLVTALEQPSIRIELPGNIVVTTTDHMIRLIRTPEVPG